MSCFVPARGDVGPPKSTTAVYGNRIGIGPNLGLHGSVNLADKAAVAQVITAGADGNHVASRGDITAG